MKQHSSCFVGARWQPWQHHLFLLLLGLPSVVVPVVVSVVLLVGGGGICMIPGPATRDGIVTSHKVNRAC